MPTARIQLGSAPICGVLAAICLVAPLANADPPCLNWVQRGPATTPSARSGHAMAFDSESAVTVMFGGSGGNYLGDTWEWNGTTWTQRSPAISPAARYGHAMAYDSGRDVTVLFGGKTAGFDGYLNDTWEWNGTTWTQRSPAISPAAVADHAMAFDYARGVTVLFGGFYEDGSFHYFGDTWEWNGTDWSQRSTTTSPSARYSHALAYDSARSVTVLFGGYGSGFLNDTWEWNGTDWTQRGPTASPEARLEHAMGYDSARSVTVLFGGYGSGFLNDTWEWNGMNWMQRTPTASPAARLEHAMAYDSARSVNALFGGYNSSNLRDTWTFGPSGPVPTIISNPASPLVCENSAVSLRAVAAGDGAMSYQWRKNGADLAADEDTFGTQTDTLVFAHAHLGDAGPYQCIVMLNNCTRAITSTATLNVYPAGSTDGNGDGLVDARDIGLFVSALVDHAPVSTTVCAYDLTPDGVLDLADVEPFVSRLLGS